MLDWKTVLVLLMGFFWIGEFIFFRNPRKSSHGKGSFMLITGAIISSIILSIILNRVGWGYIPGREGKFLQQLSLILFAGGLYIRYRGIIQLGNNYSRDILVFKDQELVSTGLYARLRHPLYLGLFMLTLAVVLFFRNSIGIVWVFVTMSMALHVRIKEEELIMEEVIGTRYQAWKEIRYRLIPYIY